MEAPDVILVTSVMTYWYLGVKWIIELLREIFPQSVIVLGGVYASLCPEHAARLGADYVVRGRAEPAAPYPAMDLYGAIEYGVSMTSFGCPFSCAYCASGILWPRYRRRSLSETLAEIEYQTALGARATSHSTTTRCCSEKKNSSTRYAGSSAQGTAAGCACIRRTACTCAR